MKISEEKDMACEASSSASLFKSKNENRENTRKDQERGHSLIGKTSILHIVNLGSTPTVSNVKLSVSLFRMYSFSYTLMHSLLCKYKYTT